MTGGPVVVDGRVKEECLEDVVVGKLTVIDLEKEVDVEGEVVVNDGRDIVVVDKELSVSELLVDRLVVVDSVGKLVEGDEVLGRETLGDVALLVDNEVEDVLIVKLVVSRGGDVLVVKASVVVVRMLVLDVAGIGLIDVDGLVVSKLEDKELVIIEVVVSKVVGMLVVEISVVVSRVVELEVAGIGPIEVKEDVVSELVIGKAVLEPDVDVVVSAVVATGGSSATTPYIAAPFARAISPNSEASHAKRYMLNQVEIRPS